MKLSVLIFREIALRVKQIDKAEDKHNHGKQRGQKSLDYTHGILRKWDEAGVHTISEITALEPESRASAAAPAAVGQSPAQPTDAATLAAWEQDWAARVRSHRRHTEE